MKTKLKNHSKITIISQDVLDQFVNKEIGATELSAVARMCDSMTKMAAVKLKYNQFQNNHDPIEYLED